MATPRDLVESTRSDSVIDIPGIQGYQSMRAADYYYLEQQEKMLVEDTQRMVNERAQQLKTISNLAALLAGFTTVNVVQINLIPETPEWAIICFGITSAVGTGLLVLAMINCSLMLVGILRYDCKRREVPFEDFWRKRCEDDFRLAFKFFSLGDSDGRRFPLTTGVPCFLLNFIFCGVIVFQNSLATVISSSTILVIALVVWWLRTERKWRGFLLASSRNLVKELPMREQREPPAGVEEGTGNGLNPGERGREPVGIVVESQRNGTESNGELESPNSPYIAHHQSGDVSRLNGSASRRKTSGSLAP